MVAKHHHTLPHKMLPELSTGLPTGRRWHSMREDTSASKVLQMAPLISLQNSEQPSRRRLGSSLGQDVKLASCSKSLEFLPIICLVCSVSPSQLCSAPPHRLEFVRCVQAASGHFGLWRFDKVPRICKTSCSQRQGRTTLLAPQKIH